MVLHKNYKYLLRSFMVSKYFFKNTHAICKFKALHIHATPVSKQKESLFLLASFFCGLTGKYPCFLYHYNNRTKQKFIAGVRISFSSRLLWDFLFVLNSLIFFEATNFRGFKLSPKPNKTLNLTFKHLSFYSGTQRAFDGQFFHFTDNSLKASLQMSFTSSLHNGFIVKGSSLPVFY